MNRLSRRDYAERVEAEDKRIRTGGHEMRDPGAANLSPADANAKRYAEESPVMASIKSSAAQSVSGLSMLQPLRCRPPMRWCRTPCVLGSAWTFRSRAVPNMPLVDYLAGMSGSYTSELQRREPGEAWDRGEFGPWLMTQMGGNSMNIIQSLGAAMVPGLQGALLGTMGATAAGSSYADGDSGIASVGKGWLRLFGKAANRGGGLCNRKSATLLIASRLRRAAPSFRMRLEGSSLVVLQ